MNILHAHVNHRKSRRNRWHLLLLYPPADPDVLDLYNTQPIGVGTEHRLESHPHLHLFDLSRG